MYSPRKLVTVYFIVALLLLTTSAFASSMPEELSYETSPGCFFSASEGNTYDGSRPIVIFFPGGGHCNTIRGTVDFIKENQLYDDLDVDFVAVAINNFTSSSDPKDWDILAKGTLEWLKEKIANLPEDENPRIIVDCMSLGGLGATYFTEYALEAGFPVEQINYADACTEVEATEEQLLKFMDQGVNVNIFTCMGPGKISARCREYVEDFEGLDNFYGVVQDCKHNQCLIEAIKNGLHTKI